MRQKTLILSRCSTYLPIDARVVADMSSDLAGSLAERRAGECDWIMCTPRKRSDLPREPLQTISQTLTLDHGTASPFPSLHETTVVCLWQPSGHPAVVCRFADPLWANDLDELHLLGVAGLQRPSQLEQVPLRNLLWLQPCSRL